MFTQTVQQVSPSPDAPDDVLILPGFIDTHVHGGGGGDTMDGVKGIREMARTHARFGTTTLLPTTMTAPWPEVVGALRAVKAVMEEGVDGGADIPGAHLEGPFISPMRLGAQPPFAIEPTADLLAEVLELDVVRAVTLAPELPGVWHAALQLTAAGIRIGIGHTRADAQTVKALLDALQAGGARTAGTHLFNAMGGIEGRLPGVPGALLTNPETFVEIILDNAHVHPTAFLLAHAAARNRVLLVTDAIRATGLGDGESELGGQRVLVKNGQARLTDGTLAGSVLTMHTALRNAVRAGVSLAEASRMLSATPAASVGLTDRGQISEGLRADLVVLNRELAIKAVYIGGQEISL
nr:N-acetylglucosamine-6-phosphate deacetylase [Deinococcus deserti]